MPAADVVDVTLTGTTALIGRTSQSRQMLPGDRPRRRHRACRGATPSSCRGSDGAWTVVDLGSANGTYVVAAGDAPDGRQPAIDVGIPAPIGDKDSVYLGAWSKLTLRDGSA